jgi:hypothetical protein
VHLTTGLGIGLFGIVSAVLAPEASRPTAPTSAAPSTSAVSITANAEVELKEGARRFYNERWNELLGIEGDWDEVQGADGTVLRPRSEDCVLGIYSFVRDEVHYLPVPVEGQVRFAKGWIAIDQVGEWKRGPSQLLQNKPSDCDTSYGEDEIADYTLNGDCWQSQDTMEDCQVALGCSGNGSTGCGVTLQLASGMRTSESHYEGACGESLYFSVCTDDEGQDTFCVDEP